MDLNERIAARRREIANEEERIRREAEQQRLKEREAERQAALALKASQPSEPPKPDVMNVPVKVLKVVDIEQQTRNFQEAVERLTVKELSIFVGLVLLSVYCVNKSMGLAIFLGLCTIGYLCKTIASHINTIKQTVKPQQ